MVIGSEKQGFPPDSRTNFNFFIFLKCFFHGGRNVQGVRECEGARDGVRVCLGIRTCVYVFHMCVYLCVCVCTSPQPPFQRFQFFLFFLILLFINGEKGREGV